MKKVHVVLLTALTVIVMVGEAVGAMETFSISAVSITDLDGTPTAVFEPGDAIRFELTLSSAVPAIVLAQGTVSYGGGVRAELGLSVKLMLGKRAAIGWEEIVPDNAEGESTLSITALSLPGWIETGDAVFEVVSEKDDDDEPVEHDTSPSRVCSACHSDLHKGWQRSKHYPVIGCTSCHGSGDEHIMSASAETISIPESSEFCYACHERNDGTTIEAEDGFLQPMQQRNELLGTGHRVNDCLTCHDPHYSPAKAPDDGLKKTCNQCHPDKAVYLNMQQLSCVDCHMPYAVVKGSVSGEGDYPRADVRSHVVRIKGSVSPEQMFAEDGSSLGPDGEGAFVTLGFSCLGCHDGGEAVDLSFEGAQQTHTLIH
ncbi:MAG: hypothetical protein GY868_13410 [Deltaproteobacteria bacterium]|nr:hypothetical protein [Deltaproteobacteria bacterium]